MSWFFIGIAALVGLVIVGAIAVHLMLLPAPGSVFQVHDALFTAAERSFLGVLDQAVGDRYRVFGKVRVADVIHPAKGIDKGQRAVLFNQIRAKHFDFVLCDPKTLDIKGAVELNDSSHASKSRSARDQLLQKACKNAQLPLLVVPCRRSYSVNDIRDLLKQMEAELKGESITVGHRIEPALYPTPDVKKDTPEYFDRIES